MINVAQNTLLGCLSKNNTETALCTPDGKQLTYSQFGDQIHHLTKSFLNKGITQGECCAIVLPNCIEILTTFLAVTSTRAIATILNPAYQQEEFKFYLEDTKSKIVLVLESMEATNPARLAAKELNIPVWELSTKGDYLELSSSEGAQEGKTTDIAPQPSDVALFLHTSGTTSRPKLVPLSHENISFSANTIAKTYELSPKDATLIAMPLFHVHGLIGATLSTLTSGGKCIIPARFSASTFWSDVEKFGATWYSAVPTIHQILLTRADSDHAPSGKLRFIRSCSSPLAAVTLEKLEKRFGCPVLEAYGMTEAAHQMASNPLPPRSRKPGSVGIQTGLEITILTDKAEPVETGKPGEVCIRGTNVTKGYWNNPKANEENFTHNGWFRTGDQGFLDAEGYLTLTGRIKELINRGGEKISPPEVDNILLQVEIIQEGYCFPAPDAKYGEEVAAAIVLKSEHRDMKNEDAIEVITKYCKTKLAPFKVPTRFFFADELPKTATGKIQRRILAAHFLKDDKN